MQRILVTGGAGFIGSHTVDLLLSRGLAVVVLDNLSSGRLANLDLKHPNLEFVEGDVLEYPAVAACVAKCDAVLHLAAVASVRQSLIDPIYTLQVNTQGSLHVLQAIQKLERPIRLVYASSASIYGDSTILPCDDAGGLTELPLPASPYALQKRHVEDYAALYQTLYGLNSLGLRYFNVYGTRQDPQSFYAGVISRFMEAYQSNQPLIVFGEGKQSRDFISVKDVARANLLALQSQATGAVNVATGQPRTVMQLIEFFDKKLKKAQACSFLPLRAGDIPASYGTVALASKILGFQAEVGLEEGIGDLLTNLR